MKEKRREEMNCQENKNNMKRQWTIDISRKKKKKKGSTDSKQYKYYISREFFK